MEKVVIEACRREELGKNAVRRMLAEGKVPAVVYGKDEPAVSLTVDYKFVDRLLSAPGGRNRIYSLSLDGTSRDVLVRDLHLDPVSDKLSHIDFLVLKEDRPVQLRMPVEYIGTAIGVKMGGLFHMNVREINVECLPKHIPAQIKVDISGLNLGQGIRVRDLNLGEGVKVLADADATMVYIEDTSAPAEAAAPVETKGKKK